MPLHPDAAALNLQPRQRRRVYMWLAEAPAGRSVKHLLGELDIAEPELRETLRKLDAAGLARRIKGTWMAIALKAAEQKIPVAAEVSDIPRAASCPACTGRRWRPPTRSPTSEAPCSYTTSWNLTV